VAKANAEDAITAAIIILKVNCNRVIDQVADTADRSAMRGGHASSMLSSWPQNACHGSEKTRVRIPAARLAPSDASISSLIKKRAQGMPVQRTHPQPCVQMEKARKQVTTGTPKQPAFPARLV
jgi:hypothetical protein